MTIRLMCSSAALAVALAVPHASPLAAQSRATATNVPTIPQEAVPQLLQ